MHPLYRYAYVTDREEGLVVVDVNMLEDQDPRNNFVERAATFNPDGRLNGASYIRVNGENAYILCDRGLVIVSIDDPVQPEIVSELGSPALDDPRAIDVMFRYAFVTDSRGLRVIDITDVEKPRLAGSLDIAEAGRLYVARTYAYVPAGSQGLAIVDVRKPEQPVLHSMYDADGKLNDTRAVVVGAAYGSIYAYVADGKNGLHVVSLITPGETPGSPGFSPEPTPRLIATRKTHGPAIALSRGLDRGRAVDASGNQIAVFGRLGSRPFNRQEMENLFLQDGELYTVSNEPPSQPEPFVRPEPPEPKAEAPAVQPEAPTRDRLLPGRR